MQNSISVIVNASAGRGHEQTLCEQLAALFREGGADARIEMAREPDDVDAAVDRALARGVSTVVAGGGDGTVSAVASRLAGTDVTLGVLPLGTLNHFAKDLGLPLRLEDAVRVVMAGHAIRVDVGCVNERIFINNASLGLYPRIVRHRERQQERLGRGKWPAFVWAAWGALRKFPMLDVSVNVDGRSRRRQTPFVFIGNNVYEMEGFKIGARPRLDANCLSLYTAQRPTRVGLLLMAFHALARTLKQAQAFDSWCAQDILIETRRSPVAIAIDGEITVLPSPLRLRSLPKALRVLVPPPAAG